MIKPKVGSWWNDSYRPDVVNPVQVLAIGERAAFVRCSDGAEIVLSLHDWEARFDQTLSLPKPRVGYVIQHADGWVPPSAYSANRIRELDAGERLLRATITYEVVEPQGEPS